jgi:hypothetical protein
MLGDTEVRFKNTTPPAVLVQVTSLSGSISVYAPVLRTSRKCLTNESTSAKRVYSGAGQTRTTFGGRKSTTRPCSRRAALIRSASECSIAT